MLYRDEVQALILIDPAHPDQSSRFPFDFNLAFKMAPYINNIFRFLSFFGFVRYSRSLSFPPTYLYEPEKRNDLHIILSDQEKWTTMNREIRDCFACFPIFKQNLRLIAQSIKEIPITVITAANRIYSPSFWPKQITDVYKIMHAEYSSMSIHGKHIMCDISDHWIHLQNPSLVTRCILSFQMDSAMI
eukprot:TRINITY_DN6893_c0_g1_i2.p1 TRINITY_DN6893_c0_g1~~TRINITY_DN6893_c0_g1_i2.p1  ORF type:complete len:188 (+),score=10.99 TRINITY_DN6893_c0_g1_i2:143-706(+)